MSTSIEWTDETWNPTRGCSRVSEGSFSDNAPMVETPGLDLIIVGGESGPCARPFDVAWARSILQQCKAAGVPCFVKQLGAKPVNGINPIGFHGRSKKGGDPSEWPEDLRVRQFPGDRELAEARA